ncbi:MAG: hypothetical protein Q7T82_11645 [Armatimonadota bacterium]|nr:hypothetical protein [Armatimonadota bacterium]
MQLTIRRFLYLLRRLVLNVYTVTGELEGDTLRLLIADDGSTLDVIRDLAFPQGAETVRKGRISAFQAPGLIKSEADMVIAGANYLLAGPYRSRGFYLAPKYTRQFLALSDGLDTALNGLPAGVQKDIRHKLRRMADLDVICRLVSDEDWVDFFYDEMYRPYTLNRFGKSAAVSELRDVRRAFGQGGALVLTQGSTPFSASIVFPENGVVRFPYSGTLPGYEDLARKGAKYVLYCQAMRVAESWGCSGIDLGHTGPFLSDGVLRFKLKWGAEVLDDDDGTGFYAIAAPGRTPAARKFVAANPFYHVMDGRLWLMEELSG